MYEFRKNYQNQKEEKSDSVVLSLPFRLYNEYTKIEFVLSVPWLEAITNCSVSILSNESSELRNRVFRK